MTSICTEVPLDASTCQDLPLDVLPPVSFTQTWGEVRDNNNTWQVVFDRYPDWETVFLP
jgi:hypothetical protein